jgi:hypothetical protein
MDFEVKYKNTTSVPAAIDDNDYMIMDFYSRNSKTSRKMEEEGNEFRYGNYDFPPPAKPFKQPTTTVMTNDVVVVETHQPPELKLVSPPPPPPPPVRITSSIQHPTTSSDTIPSNVKPHSMGSVINELKTVFSSGAPLSMATQRINVGQHGQHRNCFGHMGRTVYSSATGIAPAKVGTAKCMVNDACNDLRYAETVTRHVNHPMAQNLDELRHILNMLVIDVQSQRKKIEEIWRVCCYDENKIIRTCTMPIKPPVVAAAETAVAPPPAAPTAPPRNPNRSGVSRYASKFPSSFTTRYAVNEKTKENLLKNRRVSLNSKMDDQSSFLTSSKKVQITTNPCHSPLTMPPPRRSLSIRRFLCCF